MPLAVVIDDPQSIENWALAEADMRRFWSQRLRIFRKSDGSMITIEVGAPVRIRAKMGVDRLKSFNVKARVKNMNFVREV